MPKRLPLPKWVKIPLIILGIVLAVFAYSFWGSKLEDQNKVTRTAEAYGLDSLYAEGEPVMEVRVWQKNEKEWTDYPEKHSLLSFFYDVLPLPLNAGESVDTVCEPQVLPVHAVIEVIYDGDITGRYDLAVPNMIDYTGETDMVPSAGVSGEDVRRNNDATFSGNRKVTLRITNMAEPWLNISLDSTLPADYKKHFSEYIRDIELHHDVFLNDYYTIERFAEVYPDAPVQDKSYPNLKQYKRVVMTNNLTIQAMHPLKKGVPVASVVLEITQYSSWFGANLNDAELKFVMSKCAPSCCSGKVTVVSYEQSDTFAMG